MRFHYQQYRSTELVLIKALIRKFPLATITSSEKNHWDSSHIPLFLSEQHDMELFGHVDSANNQFSSNEPLAVHVVFHGPNAYIPPEAYLNKHLPTWNYLSVHISGSISVIDDPALNIATLRETAMRLQEESTFQVDESDTRIKRWIGSVRGLKLKINEIEGRFKLSQDKSQEDMRAAAEYFSRTLNHQVSPDFLLSFVN